MWPDRSILYSPNCCPRGVYRHFWILYRKESNIAAASSASPAKPLGFETRRAKGQARRVASKAAPKTSREGFETKNVPNCSQTGVSRRVAATSPASPAKPLAGDRQNALNCSPSRLPKPVCAHPSHAPHPCRQGVGGVLAVLQIVLAILNLALGGLVLIARMQLQSFYLCSRLATRRLEQRWKLLKELPRATSSKFGTKLNMPRTILVSPIRKPKFPMLRLVLLNKILNCLHRGTLQSKQAKSYWLC